MTKQTSQSTTSYQYGRVTPKKPKATTGNVAIHTYITCRTISPFVTVIEKNSAPKPQVANFIMYIIN